MFNLMPGGGLGRSASALIGFGLGTSFASFNVEEAPAGVSIITVSNFVERKLIEHFLKYPADLRNIDRRQFEELVAELFSGFGYDVELTKRTRDGGKDIIAVKNDVVAIKYLIECKRPDIGNHVGIRAVRELFGVKQDEGATKAILATTTYFSPDAILLSERHKWELELKAFDDLMVWIQTYLNGTGSAR